MRLWALIFDDLLDIARRLAGSNATQTDLRRAISSVYYAMFHAICQSNADTLVGANPQDRDQLAWRQVFVAGSNFGRFLRCYAKPPPSGRL